MKMLFLAMPGNEELTSLLAKRMGAIIGKVTISHFPDGESYVRIHGDLKRKKVVIVCSLNQPDKKILPLYFVSNTAKDLGANEICLLAPYLAYMRQDKRFHSGEAITSTYFASLISQFTDSLITVDPHLHRIHNLSDIYRIPTFVIHAAEMITDWIKLNIKKPLLIGPDSESEQWVSEVAKNANAPFIILNKIRHGDRSVTISFPDIKPYKDHTPVLVDDIISTAQTMIKTTDLIIKARMKPPVCIGVHGIFADNAYKDLKESGAARIVTCNTIPHVSNDIDLIDKYSSYINSAGA